MKTKAEECPDIRSTSRRHQAPNRTTVTASAIALAIAALFLSMTTTHAADQSAKQLNREIRIQAKLAYLLFLPKEYNNSGQKKWPLLLFLHGAGERGTDLSLVKVHGPPKIVEQNPEFPFITVSPQCPPDQVWSNDLLLALLDEVIAAYQVDVSRVYVTGLSMGGFGTWNLGIAHPEKFAAILPICGGGDILPVFLAGPEKRQALGTLGIWAFHGAKDMVVPLLESERMVSALKRTGHKAKLTVYPDAEHDSWTETYNNPAIYEWLLEHKRP
jgi:predicted peptidase